MEKLWQVVGFHKDRRTTDWVREFYSYNAAKEAARELIHEMADTYRKITIAEVSTIAWRDEKIETEEYVRTSAEYVRKEYTSGSTNGALENGHVPQLEHQAE